MRVAYEDVRIAPQGQLAQELMSCSVEHELGYGGPTDRRVRDIQEAGLHPSTPCLMGSAAGQKPKGAEDDICGDAETVHREAPDGPKILQSDKARILDQIHAVVGSQQVSSSKLAFAPPWIIHQAFEK